MIVQVGNWFHARRSLYWLYIMTTSVCDFYSMHFSLSRRNCQSVGNINKIYKFWIWGGKVGGSTYMWGRLKSEFSRYVLLIIETGIEHISTRQFPITHKVKVGKYATEAWWVFHDVTHRSLLFIESSLFWWAAGMQMYIQIRYNWFRTKTYGNGDHFC